MSTTTFTGPVVSENGFTTGTSAAPLLVTAAGNVSTAYASASAATGDTRLIYNKLTFTSTGSGETARIYSSVSGVGAGAAGTINGAHLTCDIVTPGTIAGAANALRATIGGTTIAMAGTLAAIQLDSNFAANVVLPGSTAFMRVTDSGTVKIEKLFNLPTTGSGLMVAPHTTEVMTDSIRVVMASGAVRYIMCTTSAANRTGGA